jgi:hypothetical protein
MKSHRAVPLPATVVWCKFGYRPLDATKLIKNKQ